MFDEIRRHAGKLYGKYSGQVVKNDIDPDNTGIILVTVPSVFGETITVPARPCLPYGHFFVPAEKTKVSVPPRKQKCGSPLSNSTHTFVFSAEPCLSDTRSR